MLCELFIDLSSLMKDKLQMIEKLESALERQQDGKLPSVGLTDSLDISVVIVMC